MGLWLYLKFPNVIEAVKYFICLKDIISCIFCHFYEIIYENQQGPCYDIAFCFNNDRITEWNSGKKKKRKKKEEKKKAISSRLIQVFWFYFSLSFWLLTKLNCISELFILSFISV